MKASKEKLLSLAGIFGIKDTFDDAVPFGSGHINDTYRVTTNGNGIIKHYTFQRINSNVFPKPFDVMENIDRVTTHLQQKIAAKNSGKRLETLNLLKTADNSPCYLDEDGNY